MEEEKLFADGFVVEEFKTNNEVHRLDVNDTWVLRARHKITEADAERMQKEMSERLGIKVIVISGMFDLVGVIKHGS